jgi:hypothetical protein
MFARPRAGRYEPAGHPRTGHLHANTAVVYSVSGCRGRWRWSAVPAETCDVAFVTRPPRRNRSLRRPDGERATRRRGAAFSAAAQRRAERPQGGATIAEAARAFRRVARYGPVWWAASDRSRERGASLIVWSQPVLTGVAWDVFRLEPGCVSPCSARVAPRRERAAMAREEKGAGGRWEPAAAAEASAGAPAVVRQGGTATPRGQAV